MAKKLFGGQLVASLRDDWGLIRIVDYAAFRSLYFDSDIEQGRLYFYDPTDPGFTYMEAMLNYLDSPQHSTQVALLGLGAGRLLAKLAQDFPQIQLEVVELRPLLPQVVKNYFIWPKEALLNLYLEDAQTWLTRPGYFDTIFVDLFHAQGSPDILSRPEFFQGLRKKLKPQGQIIANFWTQEFKPLHAFNQVFAQDFRQDTPLYQTGNWVAMAKLK